MHVHRFELKSQDKILLYHVSDFAVSATVSMSRQSGFN